MKFHTISSKGFTLIDLLLSAAFISLLSSLVLFQSSEAKKTAEDSHMKVEAQQIAGAIALYKNDHGGNPPPVGGPGQVNEMQYENDPDSQYFQTMQILVDGGYLPEIPTSPNGRSYSYGVSADLRDAVFGVRLNKENKNLNASTQNSCPAVEEGQIIPMIPEAVDLCGSAPRKPITQGNSLIKITPSGLAGTCSSGALFNSYGSSAWTCVDNTLENRNALCSCTGGVAASKNIATTPDEMCKLMSRGSCSVPLPNPLYKAFVFNNSNYQNYVTYLSNLEIYNQDMEEWRACKALPVDTVSTVALCDGTSDSDYCQCI